MPPRGNLFNRNCSWGGYILMISSHSFAKSLKRSALTVALGMCFVGAAIAAETGGLRITISGSDGQPIPGATVSVSSPDSLVSKTAVTAADGSVRLTGLAPRSEEHTSELQSLMRISYAVFCLKIKNTHTI